MQQITDLQAGHLNASAKKEAASTPDGSIYAVRVFPERLQGSWALNIPKLD